MKDEIKEKLLKEIKKYPKKQNYESGLSGYCLKVIDSTDKLNRFEKKSFSEILSRWVLEERLDQHEETSRLYQNELNLLQEQIKVKDEKFDKILDEIRNRFVEDIEEFREHHTITRSLYPENFTYFIEEIKSKRIKGE